MRFFDSTHLPEPLLLCFHITCVPFIFLRCLSVCLFALCSLGSPPKRQKPFTSRSTVTQRFRNWHPNKRHKMKAPTASAILFFAALSSCALASVSFKIVRDPDAPNLRRRSLSAQTATISESLFNNQSSGVYLAQVSVGTPPQQISLQIDTGSTDVWMVSVSTDRCQKTEGGGCLTPCEQRMRISFYCTL